METERKIERIVPTIAPIKKHTKPAGILRRMKIPALALLACTAMAPIGAGQSNTYNKNQGWSGFSVETDVNDTPRPIINRVSSSWSVANVVFDKGKDGEALPQWIGIGGTGIGTLKDSSNLMQVGTACYSSGVCIAFYELLPDDPMRLGMWNIKMGDRMYAEIGKVPNSKNSWLIKIEDRTMRWNFSMIVKYDSFQYSAECVLERPTVKINGKLSYLELPHFAEASFSDFTVNINPLYKGHKGSTFRHEIVKNGVVLTQTNVSIDGRAVNIKDIRR
jgi:hypothetical protein